MLPNGGGTSASFLITRLDWSVEFSSVPKAPYISEKYALNLVETDMLFNAIPSAVYFMRFGSDESSTYVLCNALYSDETLALSLKTVCNALAVSTYCCNAVCIFV